MPGPTVRARKGGGLKRTGSTAGSSHPRADATVARTQPSNASRNQTPRAVYSRYVRHQRGTNRYQRAHENAKTLRDIYGKSVTPAHRILSRSEFENLPTARDQTRQFNEKYSGHGGGAAGLSAAAAGHSLDVPTKAIKTAGEASTLAIPIPGAEELGAGVIAARAARALKVADAASSAPTLAKVGKTAEKVVQKVKARPRPVQATKAKVAATKPAKAVLESKPAKVVSRGANTKSVKLARKATRTTTKTAAITAPVAAAAAGAKKKGNVSGAAAPFVGTAEALAHPKTYLTTAQGLPSIVTYPLGLAENAGLTAARAGATAAGIKHYSGQEILAPVKKSADEAKNYLVGGTVKDPKTGQVSHVPGLTEIYGSGDPHVIEQATKNQLGLFPAAAAAFGLHGVAKKTHAYEKAGKAIPESIKAPIRVKAADRAHRRTEAQQAAQASVKENRLVRAAQRPTARAERAKGNRHVTHGRKLHVQAKDTLPLAVAHGLDYSHPNIKAHLAQTKKSFSSRPEGVHASEIVPNDAITHAEKNHAALGADKNLNKSIEGTRVTAKAWEARGSQPYVDAKYFHQAKDWGIPLARERFMGERNALTVKFGEKAANEAQLHFEQPEEHPISGLKKGTKGYIEALQKIDAKASKALGKDMLDLREGRYKGKERAKGLVEPHYLRDVRAGTPPHPVVGLPKMGQTSMVQHQKEGVIRSEGTADYSHKTYMAQTIARPRRREVTHQEALRFASENNIRIPESKGKGPEATTTDIRKAVQNGSLEVQRNHEGVPVSVYAKTPQGRVRVALVDRAKYKQALSDPNVKPDELVKNASGAVELDQILSDISNPMNKGRHYLIKPAAQAEEFAAQHEPTTAGIAQKAWRWPLHAVLAYSPSWLMMQPIAEGSISALAKNPISQIAAHFSAKGMTEEARHEVGAHAGSSAGTGFRTETKPSVATNAFTRKLASAKDSMLSSRSGRLAHDLLTGEGSRKIDMAKGGKINEALFLTKAYHDLGHGPLRNLGKAMKLIDPLDAELRKAGGNFAKEMDILSKRKPEMDKIGNYVYDTHGDWMSIIKSKGFEGKAAGLVSFYPWLRFSTLWFLRFGRQHPVKAAALALGANQNEQALRKMFGGGSPSFPTGWADAPIYAGTGKNLGAATKSLGPMGARVTATSNALTESALSGPITPGSLVNTLNPWIGATVNAATGINPLTGRQQLGRLPTAAEFGKTLAANLASWPALARFADQYATGKKVSRGLKGTPTTPGSLMWDIISGNATDPKGTALRNTFGVFLPASTSKEKLQSQLQGLYRRKYGGTSDTSANPIGDAVKNANAAVSSNSKNAEQAIVKALDAIVASNQLDKYQQSLGLKVGKTAHNLPPSTSKRGALIDAQLSDITIPRHWNDVMNLAIKAGIPPARLHAEQKAYAHRLMTQ